MDYDETARELDVTFVSGKTYRYFAVPPDIHVAFLAAASKGAFFNRHIKDAFAFAEVIKIMVAVGASLRLDRSSKLASLLA